MSSVQILRLNTGEEIIAEVEDEGHEYVVTKPISLMLDHQAKKLVFLPFMPYSEARLQFTIGRSHVQFATNPVESLVNDYNETVGNKPKIITPQKSIIL